MGAVEDPENAAAAESAFVRRTAANPDDDRAWEAYLAWLEGDDPDRFEYARLAREHRAAVARVESLEHDLRRLEQRVDPEWVDRAFPLIVRSGMVGRFYGRPGPDAAPFVAVGDYVGPNTPVGFIEAMGVYVRITAGMSGVVSEVLVEDKQVVEYHQPILRLERVSSWLDRW